MEDDTRERPRETEVMALLEQVICTAEKAQSFVQDDGRISGTDSEKMLDLMMHIRSLSLEIDHLMVRPAIGVLFTLDR